MTALSIVQLAERGELAVSDSVDDHIPHLANAPGDPVTIRELLTHTSGMPSNGIAEALVAEPLFGERAGTKIAGDDDFSRHVEESIEMRVTDRDPFMYYNSGYILLGKIVEAVTGLPIGDYVRENVLDPLEMERSTYSREVFESDPDRMTPAIRRDEETRTVEFPFDDLTHASGGLISSSTELGNYVRMYVNSGSFEGVNVLSSAGIEEMCSPISPFGTYFDGHEVGYGYGLMVEEFLGETLVSHGGSMGVSNAWFGFLKESGVGVAVTCTTEPELGASVVGPGILALLRDENPEEIVPQYRLRNALDSVCGTYSNFRGLGSATVERTGATLEFTHQYAAGSQTLFLVPEEIDDTTVICSSLSPSGIRRSVRFERDDDEIDVFFDRFRFSKRP